MRPFAARSRMHEDPASSAATREATVVVFDSFNRYLGVAVGECLGYLFTGVVDRARGRGDAAVVGVRRVARLAGHRDRHLPRPRLAGKFVGRFEEKGWRLAGAVVPIAYVAWSLWLIGAGVVLLVA